MEIKPVIKRITIYPIKSLDGISLSKAKVVDGGCLEHDREYAIVDDNGKFVNCKSNVLVHMLRSDINFEDEVIFFRHELEPTWNQFHLQNDETAINKFLSSFFKMKVSLHKSPEGKFLDIPVKSGVTALSTASLETVAGWFKNIKLEEARKRFRATLEISGVPAFWEDRLFYQKGIAVEFKIGEVLLYGLSPRARCVVPSRHPKNGETIHAFQKSFALQRAANLPNWSPLNNYNHAYYLSVDCYLPKTEFGKRINTGYEITITGKRYQLTNIPFSPVF